ncbi:MAG TPA: c-type cytochrome [Gaiellaceae bacterium]|nr:c-type cytochrome [Gaiellaceae bacterium]
MRRSAVIAAGLLAAGVLAGCGAQGVASPTPLTVIGTVTTPTVTFPIVPAFHVKGVAANGRSIFLTNCGSCHTLSAAGTSGAVGPNLDQLKPNYQAVTAQVTNGGAIMSPFKGTLSTQQIADVAAYVVTSTGGTVP